MNIIRTRLEKCKCGKAAAVFMWDGWFCYYCLGKNTGIRLEINSPYGVDKYIKNKISMFWKAIADKERVVFRY